jgi:hypothetical protein
MFIAMPRTAPRARSADKSDFQVLNFEVKKSAIAITGAMEAWAKSARIAQFKKSLEPVLA